MSEEELFEGPGLKPDLSPMIDLVFLLLIFFMVTANLIDYPKDPNVKVAIASDSILPEKFKDRVVMNIYRDGTLKDTGGKVYSLAQFSQLMSQAKANVPTTKLHLRADKSVPYRHIKEVSRASAEAGVTGVVFSTKQ